MLLLEGRDDDGCLDDKVSFFLGASLVEEGALEDDEDLLVDPDPVEAAAAGLAAEGFLEKKENKFF